MKLNRILLFVVLAAIIASCSKDDEPTPSNPTLETAALSFSGSTTVVAAPSAMASSQNEYAQMATGYISSVNQMTSYLSYFAPPAAATKSSTRITASNARVASSQTVYLVYTWSDANYGTVAYQVSEESDKFVFEVFFKAKSASTWLRYVYAEEKKDKSSGLMKIYDIFTGAPTTTVFFSYNWSRTGDILDFVMEVPDTDPDFSFKTTISINEKTKAGSVIYYIGGVKWYSMTWDAKGNGTWKWYDEDGTTVYESGTWTV